MVVQIVNTLTHGPFKDYSHGYFRLPAGEGLQIRTRRGLTSGVRWIEDLIDLDHCTLASITV